MGSAFHMVCRPKALQRLHRWLGTLADPAGRVVQRNITRCYDECWIYIYQLHVST